MTRTPRLTTNANEPRAKNTTQQSSALLDDDATSFSPCSRTLSHTTPTDPKIFQLPLDNKTGTPPCRPTFRQNQKPHWNSGVRGGPWALRPSNRFAEQLSFDMPMDSTNEASCNNLMRLLTCHQSTSNRGRMIARHRTQWSANDNQVQV